MPKVLVSDTLSPAAVRAFEERGIAVDVITGLAADDLKTILWEYDGLAVRSATRVTADLLATAERLKVVGRAGIGVDNIDVAAASQLGIVVMNTPFGNATTTAEHAIAMIMAMARNIPQANASTHAGRWEKSRFMGMELCGKTLGVIGCGNIGAIVADRAHGLRMRVVAFDPYLSQERAVELGVERVGLDELLMRADIITLHTPLNDATRGIIDAAALAKARPGVCVVNCARGGLVVEADLLAALRDGHVRAAALDVFEQEPARDNPLFGLDNVICTPHLGASTAEAQENVAVQVAEQMADYLLTGAVTNALNMPSVSAEDAPRLRPYMRLAERIGALAGQITRSSLSQVTVEYQGDAAALNVKPLTAVLLQGLLAPQMESVNMVNAPLIARERDIQVSEVRTDACPDYHSVVRLTVTTERQTRTVAGTLFGGAKPRIIDINGVPMEAELGRHVLYVVNEDQPGFIGALGTVLGEAGVNIASFHLGRDVRGGRAVALVSVDQAVAGPLLDRIQALPHVVQALPLEFP